jgi:hypothetical protein
MYCFINEETRFIFLKVQFQLKLHTNYYCQRKDDSIFTEDNQLPVTSNYGTYREKYYHYRTVLHIRDVLSRTQIRAVLRIKDVLPRIRMREFFPDPGSRILRPM